MSLQRLGLVHTFSCCLAACALFAADGFAQRSAQQVLADAAANEWRVRLYGPTGIAGPSRIRLGRDSVALIDVYSPPLLITDIQMIERERPRFSKAGAVVGGVFGLVAGAIIFRPSIYCVPDCAITEVLLPGAVIAAISGGVLPIVSDRWRTVYPDE